MSKDDKLNIVLRPDPDRQTQPSYLVVIGALVIARVYRYMDRIEIPIRGSRLVRHGTLRQFWAWERIPPQAGQRGWLMASRIACLREILGDPNYGRKG